MAFKIKDILKTYFESGDLPSQSNFEDLIDSIQLEASPTGNVHANGVDVDGKPVFSFFNSNDNETPINLWTGTRAQYDAIVTKQVNVLYFITSE